ncbi:MAG TPA: hypothetical protein PLP42_00045 [Acidobacteriota bacterium]|nr:hypothetical protein [Acidobacteriota bacterium]
MSSRSQGRLPEDCCRKICKAADCRLDFNSPQYRSFTKAFRLRNLLVHGHTQTVSDTWSVACKGADVLSALGVDREKELKGMIPTTVVADCEILVRQIQAAAGWKDDPFAVASRGISGTPALTRR